MASQILWFKTCPFQVVSLTFSNRTLSIWRQFYKKGKLHPCLLHKMHHHHLAIALRRLLEKAFNEFPKKIGAKKFTFNGKTVSSVSNLWKKLISIDLFWRIFAFESIASSKVWRSKLQRPPHAQYCDSISLSHAYACQHLKHIKLLSLHSRLSAVASFPCTSKHWTYIIETEPLIATISMTHALSRLLSV